MGRYTRNNKEEYLIGFPALYHLVKDRRLTLSEAIERKIVLDEDFDIVMAPKKEAQQMNHRLQIVKFTGAVKGDTENLVNFLIEKKFNIPKDEKLLLLVWLEKGLRLNYLEFGQKLDKANVPYGQIFILGQRKPDDSHIFFCCQVFPEVKIFRDLDFSFLKRAEEAKA